MRFVSRAEQDELTERHGHWRRSPSQALDDRFFDGEPLPREIVPRHWLPEGTVHGGRRIARSTDSTRYFKGPQVLVLRDDMRRLTWAATVEGQRLLLSEYLQPAASEVQRGRHTIAEGPIWRYHISLNKHTGRVCATWVSRPEGKGELWHDGRRVETQARNVDFPFFAYSQVPIGLVQSEEPPFGVLGYKCRDTGRIFLRRFEGSEPGPEQVVVEEPTVGGVSFGIMEDEVVARVDLLREDRLVPALLTSRDGGRTFGTPEPIDLTPVREQGFAPRPGYQKPIVDKGGSFHVPIGMDSDSEVLALNYVAAADMLVEAVRFKDGGLGKGDMEVFPSTLGSGNTFGNGVSDGHGLIMVVSTRKGQLFTSNSSAGGGHFPEAQLLNHEMPLVADFSASECYSSGLTPNVVSMDYVFVECNKLGRPLSGEVFIETWDMPLPLPRARATATGGSVSVEILNDADLEPGKVTFSFDDPAVNVTAVDITDLRHATVHTDREDLRGKTLAFDVLTLFHRHYGEVTVE
ncbi:hypothetical protein [Streptomyces sp. NPDC085466]|uniref:hypothetical protein n=1 Tax=Streptomyces sp. NPDC085466 TaxID=3365725 RepID=UPI0037CDF995